MPAGIFMATPHYPLDIYGLTTADRDALDLFPGLEQICQIPCLIHENDKHG